MTGNDERARKDERTLEFLRDMMTGDEPVPADVQARVERHVREQVVRRRTIGWKATGSVSLAAGLVLYLTSGADPSLAYAGLVGVSVSVYGVLVRQLIAQTT
ncbi:MAG TPA: hypothetical protein VLL48_01085 [Longimicrobiales bacterium]|nr:hypothetical protein [Longimicrobiales bacterium]